MKCSHFARGALAVCALMLVPRTAPAIDTVDPNKPISCIGTEVYYPRGDAWAFVPSTAESCGGTDPYVIGSKEQFYSAVPITTSSGPPAVTQPSNWAADVKNVDPSNVTGTGPEDQKGHCLWVFFSDGELGCANNNCPSGSTTEPSASELARMTVFADLRKWTGYNSGQQKIPAGSTSFQWTCPGTATTPTSDKASIDYTFGKTNAMPSVAFYRGNNIAESITDASGTNYNKGDKTDCFAPCIGTNCDSAKDCTHATPPCSPAPSPMLYICDNTKANAVAVSDCNGTTDCTKEVYRFQSVRNVVQWVNHAGDWANKLQYGASTLAVTETIFWPDTGVSITSDMFLNNDNVKWSWKDIFDVDNSHDYFGCSDSDPACFYLETVTTHEAGHFIGFGHVDCSSAVMYATATPQTKAFTLGIGEEAGVCALYRPAANNTTTASTAVAPAVGSPFVVTNPVRSAADNNSGTNEGCFASSDCKASGETCVFSKRSFYGSAPPTSTLTAAIPHRGVCAKACTSNTDCQVSGNFYGRVCQPYSDDGSVSYCLAGSPARPKVTAAADADLCAACESGADCSNGVCINLAASGLTDIPANAPSGICSVPCSPASGCDANFECRATGTGRFGCVPLGASNFQSCLQNALQTRQPLNSLCTAEKTCAPGLLCFSFAQASPANPEGVNACVVECDPNTPCPTPNERCLYTTSGACATDSNCPANTLCQGGACQTFIGACFKATLKEGESCALPSSATCGLKCTKQTDATPNCTEEPALGCFEADPTHPEKATCYALCSTKDATLPCPVKSQTCQPLTDANGNALATGVCTPLSSSFCLLQTGAACSANGDCDSGICSTFGALKTCTNYCDLRTQTGCPAKTQCIDVELDCNNGNCCDPTKSAACPRTRGACKVTGATALPSNCPGVAGAGCGCSSGVNPLEAALACAAVLAFLLRRRKAR